MASPLLKFALIGRQSSGKTCMLTALGSTKETNPEDIFCSLSRNKSLYENCVAQEDVKKFFTISNSDENNNANKEEEKIDSYDEMRQRTEEMLENLNKGILPEGTRFLSRTAFIYNFSTSSKTQFDVAIFDYAGELVSNKQRIPNVTEAEQQKEKNVLSQKLLEFFEKMNGLIVAVEICESDDEEIIRKHSLELQDTIEFFKAIENEGGDKARFNIPVSLIITKFDKFENFDFDEYFNRGSAYLDEIRDKYFATKRGRCIRDLAKQIESVTEKDCFKVFPSISLGDYAKTKSISFPLKSVGILEPFAWSANTYAEILHKELSQSLKICGFTNFFSVFGNSLINAFDEKSQMLCKLAPESSELFENGKKLKKTASLYRLYSLSSLVCIILCIATFGWFGGEFLIDAKDIFAIKNTPPNIENIDYSIKWLSDYSESNDLRHIVANTFYFSKKEAVTRRNELLKEKEKIEKELEYNNDLAKWEELAKIIENDLDKLKNGIQTDYSDEVFFGRLSDNISLCQRNYLDSYNQSERLNEIITVYNKYSSHYKTLKAEAEIKSVFGKNSLGGQFSESWKDGLKELWLLRSNPIIEPKRWGEVAKEAIDLYISKYKNEYKEAKKEYNKDPNWDKLSKKIEIIKSAKTEYLEKLWDSSGRPKDDFDNTFENLAKDLWYLHIKSEYDKLKDEINKYTSYNSYINQKGDLRKKAENLKNFIASSPYEYLNNSSGLENYIKDLSKADSEFTSGTIFFGKYTAEWEKHADIIYSHSRHCTLTCNWNYIVDEKTKGSDGWSSGYSSTSINVQASCNYTFYYNWKESNWTTDLGSGVIEIKGSDLINNKSIFIRSDRNHSIEVSLTFQPDIPKLRGGI